MIKLLVVDDEISIRERISKEIPWESVQAEVVGTAEDGQEALGDGRRTGTGYHHYRYRNAGV